MKISRDIPTWAWKLGLIACALIWGGSFVVIKGSLDEMPACWLMTFRFLLAGTVIAVLARRRLRENLDWSHVLAGSVLGALSGAGFAMQNVGLTYTTAGRNAFLTTVYCVLVPFAYWVVARRRPGASSLLAAGLCVVGVGLLSLGDDLSSTLGLGDWLTLGSAVFYSFQIVFVAKFSEAHDVMTLTVVQLFVTSLVCTVFAVALGEQLPPLGSLDGGFWWALAYLVLLASCVTTVLQNVGQTRVPPAQASLFLSLESVFAVIASVIFLHEVLTPRLVAGFALIFVAVLVSELGPGFLRHRRALRESRGRQA